MNSEQPRQPLPILVAEDNLDDALMLEVVFKRARITNPLQVVQDGDLAIDYIRGHGKYADRTIFPYPILFLLDLKMPRKGGMDVLRWLRENAPEPPLPVVVTAGKGEMREVNCAYSLGARSFLVKPLNWLDVMELLSCFRDLRLAAEGDSYVLEPIRVTPARTITPKPTLLNYKPQPLDTSRLKLTDDILRLTELLAENNHEVWARDRMQQGWTYGPKRDDEKKEHPCLVPYRDLPESEKLVDRNVALETIRTIFSFGLPYPILENATDHVRAEVTEQTLLALQKPSLSPQELGSIWEQHNTVVWSQNVELYRGAMSAALRFGEAFLAFEIAAEGLKKYSTDIHLQQMQAVALARTGAQHAATTILDQLRSSGPQDANTLALLACTYKDLANLGAEAGATRRHVKLSYELFSAAYRKSHTAEHGINTAAMALIYGERQVAMETAFELEQRCRKNLQALTPPSPECVPNFLTLAEALLIEGNVYEAERFYRLAGDAAGSQWRPLHRARAEARRLLQCLGRGRNELDAAFNLPQIVVCSGEMFDKPEQSQMRFPFGLEARVREMIRAKLAQLNAQIGFCSVSSGAELLFAEAILERHGELHVVLPCHRQVFKTTRVEIIPGANFGERFDRILAAAATVTILDEEVSDPDEIAEDFFHKNLVGKALLKGKMLSFDVTQLLIENRPPASVEQQQTHLVTETLDLGPLVDESKDCFVQQRQRKIQPANEIAQPGEASQLVKAVLSADIIGHSRLSRNQQPQFLQQFLNNIAALLEKLPNKPSVRNTWGDRIHIVFDELLDAGNFALMLRDFIQAQDWGAAGLPTELNLRITLHAGPVYPCVDPVSHTTTFLGDNATYSIDFDRIFTEGQIYTTEAFAALSESAGIKDYCCDFVGQKQIPKRYSSVPVFVLRRSTAERS